MFAREPNLQYLLIVICLQRKEEMIETISITRNKNGEGETERERERE